MSILTAIKSDERVRDVQVTSTTLTVTLMDSRVISVPLFWYPRLNQATAQELADWQPCGGGYGIYWPQLDEHLSVEGFLRGAPSAEL